MREITLLNLPLFDFMSCRAHDTELRNVVANISNKVAIYKNLIRSINKNKLSIRLTEVLWTGFGLIIILHNIYDLYRAYTGGSMRHYNEKNKQYIELEVK